MNKIIFLDRDGVINEEPESHVTDWSDFHFMPGVKSSLRRAKDNGYSVFVITNQSCIGRGTVSRETIDHIMENMSSEIAESGGEIKKVYYCPHAPDEGCDCRKPKPGLLLRASEENDINLPEAWFIGDKVTDIEAGRRAGVRMIYIERGSKPSESVESTPGDAVNIVANLSEAVDYIIAADKG